MGNEDCVDITRKQVQGCRLAVCGFIQSFILVHADHILHQAHI